MKSLTLSSGKSREPEALHQSLLDPLGVEEAESVLLELADYIYGHTSLKPMSKAIFLISRCLLVCKHAGIITTAHHLRVTYHKLHESGIARGLNDDFSFSSLVDECGPHIEKILGSVNRVARLAGGFDSSGLIFNTLLRGKYEGGEGLGTFLTPEEVVNPLVEMLISTVPDSALATIGEGGLYGDICGGTGRFVYALAQKLRGRLPPQRDVAAAARLFDQSSLAVDFARINFLLEDKSGHFVRVDDSLTDSEVSNSRGKFVLLATNPPFGQGKYRFNMWLEGCLPKSILWKLGLKGGTDCTDPSALFFFRNLDLLAESGALAIVLPDGVIQSDWFRSALETYDQEFGPVKIEAVLSLPVVTFSLGGTVAKTSCVIVSRAPKSLRSGTYAAAINHIGFLKRGNRRRIDPRGNDLDRIAHDYASQHPKLGVRVDDWRACPSLSSSSMVHLPTEVNGTTLQLSKLVDVIRRSAIALSGEGNFHHSVLDVDDTGLIDVVAASRNCPTTPALACEPGDIVVSCINPRKWRVAVIPQLPGRWTCSSEFAVLRPRDTTMSWALGISLHHASVMREIQSKAGGTSSSRQRAPKESLTDVSVPVDILSSHDIGEHELFRTTYYSARLREARAYSRIHNGEVRFRLD